MTASASEHDFTVPPEHALMVIDMKGYSQVPEAKMAPVRSDLDDILSVVLAQTGVEDPRGRPGGYKDTGDGAIMVFPASIVPLLVDPLLGHLSAALMRYDRGRLASAPAIRLRASVHVGPLSLPDHRGDAINEACRLVDSVAVRRAMTAAVDHGALLAAVVSDTVFGRTVAAGRTPALKEQHFHRATARIEGKPGFEQTCWLFVPGLVPSVLAPYLAQDSDDVPGGRPSQAAERSTKGATTNEGSGAVRQKGKASGKARLIQVGRDYIPGQEQS